jgi:hypothetical protein
MPVSKSHEQIGDATIAEGILDRIIHCAHRIDLRGDSLRKNPLKSQRSPTPFDLCIAGPFSRGPRKPSLRSDA